MRTASLALSLLIVVAPPAAARHRLHRIAAPILPSADALELAGIAPPTSRSTAEQTYGDSAFARGRAQAREHAEVAIDEAQAAGAPVGCDSRIATTDAYVCREDPRTPSYRDGYVFTPSHVSAPTVFDQDPRVQEPVMPVVTRFFWDVNSARVDEH